VGAHQRRRHAIKLATGEDADEDATLDCKPAAKNTAMDHEEDDVVVSEAPAPRNVLIAAAGSSNSDEIEVVGTVNQVLLPHMRQHCTEEPFLPYNHNGTAKEQRDNNVKVCGLCY
jgi:hypothetical protein